MLKEIFGAIRPEFPGTISPKSYLASMGVFFHLYGMLQQTIASNENILSCCIHVFFNERAHASYIMVGNNDHMSHVFNS